MSGDPNYPVYLGAQHGLTYQRGYKDGYTNALARMAELAEIAESAAQPLKITMSGPCDIDLIPDTSALKEGQSYGETRE